MKLSSEKENRGRSRSIELTRRSDSRSNSALRRTPKMINDSVEKEITNFFKKKFTDKFSDNNKFQERNLQEKIDFIRRIYMKHDHAAFSDD